MICVMSAARVPAVASVERATATTQFVRERLDDFIGVLRVIEGFALALALLAQAMELEAQITATGLVTAEQAAQIEIWAFSAEAAAAGADVLAQAQYTLGTEVITNDGAVANLVGKIVELEAAHQRGALASDTFGGASGEKNARRFEVYGYSFLGRKPG